MQNFEFYNPTKLIFGQGTIPQIGKEIFLHEHQKILLIAGKGSIRKNGVYVQVIGSLSKYNLSWVECWGVQPNPTLEQVQKMIQTGREEDVDAILAVGGGSVIDSAKIVAAGLTLHSDIWPLFEMKQPIVHALPLFTVLTLSATGSEMNANAVLTNEKQKKKYSVYGPALYPIASIVDPLVQRSLPWYETVNGSLDAISHILESSFAKDYSETTLAINEALIRTLIGVTDRLQKKADDYEARANLAWAATVALNGMTGVGQGTGNWACHGLEHGLSAIKEDISHGAGLGVVFPAWILYSQKTNPEVFQRWGRNVWNASSVDEAVEVMREKIRSWGHPTTLAQLGIKPDDFPAIAEHAQNAGLIGYDNPLSKQELLAILELAK